MISKLTAKAMAAVLLIVALALGARWGMDYFREQGRQQVRQEYAAKLAKAKDDARLVTDELRKQRDSAQELANERQKTIRAMSDASAAAVNGLRDELAAARRSLSSDSLEAARHRADTLADLLGACAAEYQQVARSADGHASDAKTLNDSWPNPPTK
jgi:hypothetical protein